MKSLLHLSASELKALNTIAVFLVLDDFSGNIPQTVEADMIILAGHAVLPNIEGAIQLAKSRNLPLVITGGIGHSTHFLREVIAKHPDYHHISTRDKSEAEIISDLAIQFFELEKDQILLETQSTNCGQNALFTRDMLNQLHRMPHNVILIQDPTMQRRTDATFRHVWQSQNNKVRFWNWPVLTPQLKQEGDKIAFTDNRIGLWSVDRFISLLTGEIPRLRDNEQGYGPRGRNFIAHVTIPDEIENAYQRLVAQDSSLSSYLTRISAG